MRTYQQATTQPNLIVRLHELRDDPLFGLLAVAETGVRVLALPEILREFEHAALTPEFPLDIVATESHGDVAGAFANALTDGYATTVARHIDGELRRVDTYNQLEEHGCMVTVVSTGAEDFIDLRSRAEPRSPVARRAEMHLDGGGRILSASTGFKQMFGRDPIDLPGQPGAEGVHPDDSVLNTQKWAEALTAPGEPIRFRQRTHVADGEWLWGEWTFTNRFDHSDPHMFVEVVDIDGEMRAQQALQEREALLVRITDALPVGVVHVISDDRVVLANKQWTELTGQPNLAVESSSLSTSDQPVERVFDAFRNTVEVEDVCRSVLRTGTDVTLRVRIADEANDCVHGDLQVRRLVGDSGDASLLLTLTDVTEAVAMQARLQFEARNDHLTKILNRHGLEERIDELIGSDQTSDLKLAMLYLDLDGFKTVNDLCGHRRGDEVLQLLAIRLSDLVRDRDQIGRLGGDEFIVIAQVETQAEAQAMQRRIQSRLRIEVERDGADALLVTASVGVAIAEPGDTFHSLTHRADAAMYRRKERRSTDSFDEQS